MRLILLVALSMGFTCSTALHARETKDAKPVPGISNQKPADGPIIETPRGFLTAYSQQIPGTDITFKMVPVPGQVVQVGIGANELEGDQPTSSPAKVKVPPFWIGECEVTWAEYQYFMEMNKRFAQISQLRNMVPMTAASGKPVEPVLRQYEQLWSAIESTPQHLDGVTAPTPLYDPSTTYESGEDPSLPAVTMTPYAARQYTKWLSGITGTQYRLPTEAEWEHAARAGGSGPYGAGADHGDITAEQIEDYAWNTDNSDYASHEVRSKKPNAWGLYDMLGNAAEWVLDESLVTDGNEATAEEQVQSLYDAVAWPTQATNRIAKGGYWDAETADTRIVSRMLSDDEEWKLSDPNFPKSPWWFTEYPAGGVGMRIVRPLEPMDAATLKRVWEIDAKLIQEDVDSRLEEGRGKLERVGPNLPGAIDQLQERAVQKLLK